MGGSLGHLTSRQVERLKSELAEVIITNFCYPAFLDYRLNMLRTRPVDRRKRQEVWAYINSVNFGPLAAVDASSMEFRRFVERVFLRYIDMNRALMATASTRQVAAARARVPLLAVSVARGLMDYLAVDDASAFGRARLVESWRAISEGFREITWEQIEKSTQVLQTTLVYLRSTGGQRAANAVAGGTRPHEAALIDISAYPTRVLTPVDPERRLAPAGSTNGTSAATSRATLGHDADNGSRNGLEEQTLRPSPVMEREPGARNLFPGPSRLPTISRPVDRSFEIPSAMPPESAPIEREAPPPPPVQPTPAPQPAMSSQPAASADAASSDQPLLDLSDLPESFAVPHLPDLPPDLAELYGDYLRDSRSASLDLTSASQQAEAPASLPPGETDEEVDALFTALTNRIAAREKLEWTANPQPTAGPEESADRSRSGATAQKQSGALGAAQEASEVSWASEPLSGQRGGSAPLDAQEQGAPVEAARGMTDGDVMIFAQLQHQISTWVKMAAVSHQIDLAGRDAPELVAELRRTAALEEAELQVIESLVTLCYRVTSTKQATMEDYKQAMMLYLLHHRSRLAL
ncbi:MAG TPA: hypothetical protein VH599_18285 [Ktedonobacterales bacterium]